jgi:hypothetical protein
MMRSRMRARGTALWLALVVTVSALTAVGQDHGHGEDHHHADAPAAVLASPSAMQAEHRHLHEQLAAAMAAGGRTAEAAAAVKEVLAPHFAEEEAFASPPLSLLEPLAHGHEPSAEQLHAALEMTARLRERYPQMLEEHRAITAALERLAEAAREENKPEQLAFAHALKLHAQHEEQVLYPAALLLGEYLRHRPTTQPVERH